VEVQVLQSQVVGPHYQRKILLRLKDDGRAVQFGIVRLTLGLLSQAVQAQILSERTPLGRVLIENEVLRQVRLQSIWQVKCGDELASAFETQPGMVTYGRTAQILFQQQPAVELLEIVAP
jgi:chorismate-pyruvate lyase